METISVLEGTNGKMDDKLKQAKERREEQDKMLAARERAWQEREERARLLQEQQRDERRRRAEQQRERDDKRRAAADDKRRHLTAVEQVLPVIQRTLERRSSLDTRRNRWSWGGNSSVATSPHSPVQEGGRSLASNMNQPKAGESFINRRFSASSAGICGSPDRARAPFERRPSEVNVVSRLMAPTRSSLARSRSCAVLSLTGLGSTARVGSSGAPVIPPNRPLRSRSGDRLSKDSSDNGSSQDIEGSPRSQETPPTMRREAARSKRSPSPAAEANDKSATSPAGSAARLPSPAKSSPARRRRASPGNATPQSPSRHRPPSPGNPRQARRSGERTKERASPAGDVKSPGTPEKKLPRGAKAKDRDGGAEVAAEQAAAAAAGDSRAGTSNAEEATRLLGEKRRQAREQREREEVERRVREENERLMREELARRKAEERQRRQEEARRLEEERARAAAEKEARAAADRLQHERDEHNKLLDLQRQREEAEARALEEVERQRQEREKVFQREELERQERKKRLEQIMSRTRKPYKADVGKSVLEPIVAVEESQNKSLDFISEDGSGQAEDSAAEEDKEEEEEEALSGGGSPGCVDGGDGGDAADPDHDLGSILVPEGILTEKKRDVLEKIPEHVLPAAIEAFDEVQSMDVSPVSKDDGLSAPDFSPLYEPASALTVGAPREGDDDAAAARREAGDGAEEPGDGASDDARRPPPASLVPAPPIAHRADDMSNSNVVPASVSVSSDVRAAISAVGNGALLEL